MMGQGTELNTCQLAAREEAIPCGTRALEALSGVGAAQGCALGWRQCKLSCLWGRTDRQTPWYARCVW